MRRGFQNDKHPVVLDYSKKQYQSPSQSTFHQILYDDGLLREK